MAHDLTKPDPVPPVPLVLGYDQSKVRSVGVGRLVLGVLAGFLLIGMGLVMVGALAMVWTVHATDWVDWLFRFVASLALLGLIPLFGVGGIVQLLASFCMMWNPTRGHWWDKWFVTIGKDPGA